MRHLEIRDLWLQKEVQDGKLEISKVPGEKNPADLMTKVLGVRDIVDRLARMSMRLERSLDDPLEGVGEIDGGRHHQIHNLLHRTGVLRKQEKSVRK